MEAELAVLQVEANPAFVFENPFAEDDLTEDLTVLEPFSKKEKSASFYLFLRSPYYPHTLCFILRRFFKEVRLRMMESREYDRIHYPHTVYQKSRHMLRKCFLHVKNNLSS